MLLFSNQFGRQILEADLRTFMALAKPDMLTFDDYRFGSGFESFHKAGSPTLL
jgi:hypothetical protein